MTVLIAEDEKDIRELVKISLEDSGYTVLSAQNGREAWELFKKHQVHLAILDVMMPVMDGYTLLQKLRECSTVPIILLTARTGDTDKVLGLGLGADDHLSKPFSVAELIARVGAQLRRSSGAFPAGDRARRLLVCGGLSVDRETCCVKRGEETLELSAKEYRLLLFFMENQERVFTKRQLYRAVWEDDSFYDDNTVMVHISRLRNRIEADPKNPRYLKTLRGIGYKFHCGSEAP